MKSIINIQKGAYWQSAKIRWPLLGIVLCFFTLSLSAQEDETNPIPTNRPVRATFESSLIIDNQTVMVPVKGTFQFDIQHRFGTIQNGFEDLFGFYAPSNIRLGFQYSPIDHLAIGFGFTKTNNLLDFNGKYNLLEQYTNGGSPVSLTYYGNIVLDPRSEDDREIYHTSDRLSYFHQVLIARRINDWLSVQIAPSLSHYNLQINRGLDNDHFAVALGVQAKISSVMSIIGNIDQPLTKHVKGNPSPNPNPNLSLGIQMSTSSHAFQIFLGNYNRLVPQENNVYYRGNNYDDFSSFWKDFGSRFRLGFNITRLWN
jgi:hypothetical protein